MSIPRINFFKNYLSQIVSARDHSPSPIKITCQHIFEGGDLGAFTHWIRGDQNSFKIKERVSGVLSPHQLNPLHICAMLGKVKHAEEIFKLKVLDPNQKDRQGWSFEHFAAFINDSDLISIGRKNGVLLQRNMRGALPSDIQNLLKHKTGNLTFRHRNMDGRIVTGSEEDFKRLTGKDLIKEIAISEEHLWEDWKVGEALPYTLPLQFMEALERFQHYQPQLFIEKRAQIGWEVIAEELIPKGTFIAEYLGEYSPNFEPFVLTLSPSALKENIPQLESIKFRLRKIDGKRMANLAVFANDGTPNAAMLTLPNIRGVEERHYLYALEDIHFGTPIRWDYTSLSEVKIGPHQEVSFDHLRMTYSDLKMKWVNLDKAFKGLLLKILPVLISSADPNDRFLDVMSALSSEEKNLYHKINYLINTPQALAALVVSQTISMSEIAFIIEYGISAIANPPILQSLAKTLINIPVSNLSPDERQTAIQAIFSLNFLDLLSYLSKLKK